MSETKEWNILKDASIVHSKQHNNQVSCSILSKKNYFKLNKTSGLLSTAKRIDREEICPYKTTCSVTVTVAVELPNLIQIVKVHVEIQDVNDNSPTFPAPTVALAIPESANVKMSQTIPGADDRDSPRFGIKDYKLETESSKFELEFHQNKEDVADLKLVLKEKLDREVENFYSLKILATDAGVPSNVGTLIVNITVLDVNDNAPKFDSSEYLFKSPENKKVSSELGKVLATDPDHGQNGEVIYSFDQKTQQTYGEQFGIETITGFIFLKGSLDYEKKQSYQLSVIAKDQGPISLMTYAKVIIEVEDVNDHSPEIKVSTLSDANVASISEYRHTGVFVAHVATKDPDQGVNGQFSCSLNSEYFKLREINGEGEYEIVTLVVFDREERDQYNVSLKCRDHGTPRLSSEQLITIRIKDINDNYPRFVQSPYYAGINENNYVGAEILRVSATDKDTGDNGKITYEIDGGESEWVNIEPDTGAITAKAIFDFEQNKLFTFTVIAKDNGDNPQSSSASVIVRINDVNDVAPVFKDTKNAFGLDENKSPGSFVGKVIATDIDSPPFDRITYSLEGSDDDLTTFSIDPQTGKLVTRKTLDREYENNYQFRVIAKDSGEPPLTSSATVVIYVADENDNVPVIDLPNPFNDTKYISPEIPVGYEIYHVKAHDNDVGENAKLSFNLISANKQSIPYFEIHPWTGVVTLKQKLPKTEGQETFKFLLRVTDGGKNQNKAEIDFKIIVDETIPYVRVEAKTDVNFSSQNTFILIAVATVAFCIIFILLMVLVYVKLKQKAYDRGEYNYCAAAATAAALENKDMNWQDLLTSMGKFSAGKGDYDISPDDWKSIGTGKSNRSNSLGRSKDNFLVINRQKGGTNKSGNTDSGVASSVSIIFDMIYMFVQNRK